MFNTIPDLSSEFDTPEIVRTLRLFVAPGNIGEVRIIPTTGSVCGFFFRHDQADAAAVLATNFDKTAKGVYIVMNDVAPAKFIDRELLTIQYSDLSKDSDIIRRRWILIDFDPKRSSNVSSTDNEKAASSDLRNIVHEYLRQHAFPAGCLADSGNGHHLLFRVDMPNDDTTQALVKSLLAALAAKFDTDAVSIDTAVHNASRITKLYGTTARKGENTVDRPHRRSSVLQANHETAVLSAEQISAVITDCRSSEAVDLFDHASGGQAVGATLTSKTLLPATFESGTKHFNMLSAAGVARSAGFEENEIFAFLSTLRETRTSCDFTTDGIRQIARDYAKRDCNLGLKALMTSADPVAFDVAERQQKLKRSLEHASKRLANGDDVSEIASKIQTALDDINSAEKPQEYRTMTSAELDSADLKTEYLVTDVLARHQTTILAGSKKCLKTNVAIDLTLSLASRCKFLDKFYIPTAVRVALMSGESGDATIQETARRIARSKSWSSLADYDLATWSFDLPKLGRPTTKRDLTKFITDRELEVIIIDPAYLCLDLGDDAGNLFAVGKKLIELTEVQQDTGCTVILIHHNRKNGHADPHKIPELEDIAWSGFQEWSRQWILLNRSECYDPENSGSHKLWLSFGGSAGHSGLYSLGIEEGSPNDTYGRRWEVTIESASKAIAEKCEQRESDKEAVKTSKETRRVSSDAEKLLKQYQKRPDGETTRFYRESAGLSGGRECPARLKLLDEGLIEPCEITKNGRLYQGFKLVDIGSGTNGTERDSSGTVPVSHDDRHREGQPPLGGSPDPADRDMQCSVLDDDCKSVPLIPKKRKRSAKSKVPAAVIGTDNNAGHHMTTDPDPTAGTHDGRLFAVVESTNGH